ncbi:MAG: hypothetical protein ACK56F_26940, partial [bacterium]
MLEQAEEALVARERASQPAATALRNGRADQETRRSTCTHEDITDLQKDIHVIPQRRAAEEEKKTAQQARLTSIREQQASLAAQPLMRWLLTVPAEARVEPTEEAASAEATAGAEEATGAEATTGAEEAVSAEATTGAEEAANAEATTGAEEA